jgi:hypothetical protein
MRERHQLQQIRGGTGTRAGPQNAPVVKVQLTLVSGFPARSLMAAVPPVTVTV